MSKRDELAAVLGYAEQEYAENYRPEHGADAVLAWLGEQFDEGLRGEVFDAVRGTGTWNEGLARADAAIAVVREHLSLSDAAQDAQDGAVGPGSVRMGTGVGGALNGAQIEDFEGER